jgi:hypothetical protein
MEFYFTFGFEHRLVSYNPERPMNSPSVFAQGISLDHRYVIIEADDREEARAKMLNLFGRDWAFQYSEKEFAGQVEKYGLKELKWKQI